MRCHDDAGTESHVESQVITQVDTALNCAWIYLLVAAEPLGLYADLLKWARKTCALATALVRKYCKHLLHWYRKGTNWNGNTGPAKRNGKLSLIS
jgi:hypothetical protein